MSLKFANAENAPLFATRSTAKMHTFLVVKITSNHKFPTKTNALKVTDLYNRDFIVYLAGNQKNLILS